MNHNPIILVPVYLYFIIHLIIEEVKYIKRTYFYVSTYCLLQIFLIVIHLGKEHDKVFKKFPITVFRRVKSLKEDPFGPILEKKKGYCKSYKHAKCKIRKHICYKQTFDQDLIIRNQLKGVLLKTK